MGHDTLTVTVNPVYNVTAADSICEGNSYAFGSQTLVTWQVPMLKPFTVPAVATLLQPHAEREPRVHGNGYRYHLPRRHTLAWHYNRLARRVYNIGGILPPPRVAIPPFTSHCS